MIDLKSIKKAGFGSIIKLLLCMALVTGVSVPSEAQNIFTSVKEKLSGSSSNAKKKDKKKKETNVVDPLELSLDENVAIPAVGEKQHDALVAYMNGVAKKLASRKKERVETMRGGEVVVTTISSDLLFEPNDTVLSQSAANMLQPYMGFMRQPGMYKLIVVAHTDDTGSELYTDMLSEARVNAVSEYLINGLHEHATIVPYALGASDPLYPNNTMSNRRANRRIEIFIVPDVLLIEMAKSNKLQ